MRYMENKNMLWFTIIGVILIIYGLFSRYMAFDAINQLHKSETQDISFCEFITLSGNMAQYSPADYISAGLVYEIQIKSLTNSIYMI